MRVLLAAVSCILFLNSYSQTNVGIGTTAPTNRLHVVNTADPLRLEGVSSGAITDSLLTINSTGVIKRRTVASVLSSGTGWFLTGNTGTTSSFLGTTNAVGLYFRTYNQKSGFIDFDSTKRNNAFGNRAQNAVTTTTTGVGNNAIGYQSQYLLTSGSNNVSVGDSAGYSLTSGSDNVTIGSDAGILLGAGNQNIAIGTRSLANAVAGSTNIAIGTRALENHVAAGNIALGDSALNKNNFGSDNLAIGLNALKENVGAYNINIAIGNNALSKAVASTEQMAIGYNAGVGIASGAYNTMVGHYALSAPFTATTNYNTAIGYQAGASQISGSNNTYIGYQSGGAITTGSNNTFIGYLAGAGSTSTTPVSANVSNTVVIGNGSAATASNLVRLGNTSTTVIGGSVGFSTLSDERIKKNIQEDVKGLSFISLLRPVTYNYDLQKADDMQGVPQAARTSYTEKQGIRYSGFLAQEVEAAAMKTGYNFSGVNKPQNEQSLYSINYSEIVVPLVKAVQELKTIVEKQQQEIEKLKAQLGNK
jgi:trimeric autotransporter adhesin